MHCLSEASEECLNTAHAETNAMLMTYWVAFPDDHCPCTWAYAFQAHLLTPQVVRLLGFRVSGFGVFYLDKKTG
jgi:hypothetical protein